MNIVTVRRADKDDETEYVIKIPQCIAPGAITALQRYAAELPKMGAPARHIRLAIEVADDLETQFFEPKETK